MKVCFIGGGISKALKGKVVGGAEKQQALIIKGLKEHGLDTVVLEYFLVSPLKIDKIDFLPAWGKGNKTFFSKIKALKTYIIKNDIDVIYARGTQIYIAFLYAILKVTGSRTKLLWGIAGDHDLTSKYNYLRVNQAKSIYAKLNSGVVFNLSSLLTFYFADTIVCQTQEQMLRCKSISNKKPRVLISNIYSGNIFKEGSYKDKIDALWIGKFSGVKGEEILLKIAKDIPYLNILCLGHVTEEFENTKTYIQITKQKNITLMGRVDLMEVNKYISRANFILNTSPSEGLSNVFLEGWYQKKPVISFKVNPNQYLTKWKSGFCANGNYPGLIRKIKELNNNNELLRFYGENGFKILNKFHSKEDIINKYVELFNK